MSNPKDDFEVLQVKLSDFGESWGNIAPATQCMTHINMNTKYVYLRKYTRNKNEKATEILFCESNEN